MCVSDHYWVLFLLLMLLLAVNTLFISNLKALVFLLRKRLDNQDQKLEEQEKLILQLTKKDKEGT